MRRGIGRLRAGGSGSFSPSQISFTSGLWLDPSDISTGYVDSAGNTAQSASGQLTGLRLDKSRGLARGSELNGDTALIGNGFWTTSAGTSVGSGKMAFTGTTSGNTVYRLNALTVNVTYEVTVTIANYSGGGVRIDLGSPRSSTYTANGTYTFKGTADGTTFYVEAVGTTTLDVTSVSFKTLAGLHVLQATSSARPEYDVISGISSDYLDGLDDGYSTAAFAAGTLVNGMDCFVAVKRASVAKGIMCSDSAVARIFGAWDSSDAVSSTVAAAGTPSLFVNGAAVTNNRAALHTAMPNGTWVVLEYQGLDLSAWASFSISSFPAWPVGADEGGVILCPSQSATNRTNIRRWLGAKVGLSL